MITEPTVIASDLLQGPDHLTEVKVTLTSPARKHRRWSREQDTRPQLRGQPANRWRTGNRSAQAP